MDQASGETKAFSTLQAAWIAMLVDDLSTALGTTISNEPSFHVAFAFSGTTSAGRTILRYICRHSDSVL